MTIKILFGPRFKPGTLMFALGLTFEPMNRFQSVFHENCLEFSGQFNGAMFDSPRSFYKKLRSKFYMVQDSNLGP